TAAQHRRQPVMRAVEQHRRLEDRDAGLVQRDERPPRGEAEPGDDPVGVDLLRARHPDRPRRPPAPPAPAQRLPTAPSEELHIAARPSPAMTPWASTSSALATPTARAAPQPCTAPASASRRRCVRSFESRTPGSGSTDQTSAATAPTATGPAMAPRPTSSSPI